MAQALCFWTLRGEIDPAESEFEVESLYFEFRANLQISTGACTRGFPLRGGVEDPLSIFRDVLNYYFENILEPFWKMVKKVCSDACQFVQTPVEIRKFARNSK